MHKIHKHGKGEHTHMIKKCPSLVCTPYKLKSLCVHNIPRKSFIERYSEHCTVSHRRHQDKSW